MTIKKEGEMPIADASFAEKLAYVQKELKAPKNQRNAFGNYNYRSCEDILEAVKPLLGNLTLVLSDEVFPYYSTHDPAFVDITTTDKTGRTFVRKELLNFDRFYIKATATLSDGKTSLAVSAYAREEDSKKGMDGAQVTGASSSYARKYALNGLFLIDDTKDADSDAPKNPAYIPRLAYTAKPLETPSVTPKVINTPTEAKKATEALKKPTTAVETFDGGLPLPDDIVQTAYKDERGAVLRDDKGHTACVLCGRVVSKPVEQFSMQRYKKILCMGCQKKEGAK